MTISDKNTDLLLQELEKTFLSKEDSLGKINSIIIFCRKHFNILNDAVYSFIEKSTNLALKEDFSSELDILNVYKAFYLLHYEKRKEAANLCYSAFPNLLIKKSYPEYGLAVFVVAQIEWAKGYFEKAFDILDNALKSLNYKRNKQAALTIIYYTKAVFFLDLNKLDQSYNYYSLANQNCDKNTEIGIVAYIKIGLATVLKKNGDFAKAITFLTESSVLSKKNALWNTEARAYYELGSIYILNKQLKRAKDFFSKSYTIRKKNNAYPALVSTMISIAQLSLQEENYEEAENYLNEALKICEKRDLITKMVAVLHLLSVVAESQQQFELSLHYYKKYNLLDKEIGRNGATRNSDFSLNHKSENESKLKKTSRYLNVINAFAAGFLKANTVDEIVWMVSREAIGKLGYEDCIVYLFDEKREFLIQRAAWGPKNPVDFDIHNPIKLKPGLGIVGHVVDSGIGEIINDTTKDPRYIADDESRLSEITVPIIADGIVIGIIDSEHHERNFYSLDDLKILTTIASMTSSRLAQAFAIEKLNKHQLILEQSVKNKTKELQLTLNHLQTTNNKLSSSNDEKDILLKEVHHRVKNNLQIITSLLSLQSINIDNQKTKDLFHNSQNRINTMALIHEMLYQSDDFSKINYVEYLNILIDNLLTTFKGNDHKIKTIIDITEIYLNIDTAIPLGLLINEIITNSLKYAFNDDNYSGVLSLKIYKLEEPDKYFMEIGDNGPGLSHKVSLSRRKTLGMQLINKLIRQIKGEITVNKKKKGTHYQILFENI